jgi:hypothetical protein
MAGSPKTAQAIGQTGSDGDGTRPESRQTGEDRQSQAGNMENATASIH